MGKLVLYGSQPSCAFRAVLLTLNALELEYDFKEVNLFRGHHLAPDFIEKNPQHTIPVLEENGQYIWDSHAICAYLVRKYAKNDALYPKDFYQRAVVDQRLHFDSGVLFPSLRNISAPLFFKNETNIPQDKINAIYDGYDFLETFLQHDYLAGDTLTIADFSAVSTVTNLVSFAPINVVKTPKLNKWINRLSTLPYYEQSNAKGAALFGQFAKEALGPK